jgi:hypothetical protein
MVASGELRAYADLDWPSETTLASLQGGLMLTQSPRDLQQLRRALLMAHALISDYRTS